MFQRFFDLRPKNIAELLFDALLLALSLNNKTPEADTPAHTSSSGILVSHPWRSVSFRDTSTASTVATSRISFVMCCTTQAQRLFSPQCGQIKHFWRKFMIVSQISFVMCGTRHIDGLLPDALTNAFLGKVHDPSNIYATSKFS